jgi:hypothetical protein
MSLTRNYWLSHLQLCLQAVTVNQPLVVHHPWGVELRLHGCLLAERRCDLFALRLMLHGVHLTPIRSATRVSMLDS